MSSITRCPTVGPRSLAVNSGTTGSRAGPPCHSVLAVCSGAGFTGCSRTGSSHTGRGSGDNASRPPAGWGARDLPGPLALGLATAAAVTPVTSAAMPSPTAPGSPLSLQTPSTGATTFSTPRIPTSLASSSSYSSSLPC